MRANYKRLWRGIAAPYAVNGWLFGKMGLASIDCGQQIRILAGPFRMNCIKLLCSVLLVAASATAGAAASGTASDRLVPDDYLNLLRIDLRATKAEVVTDAMELTEEEAKEFWPIYSEYDRELSKMNTRRINVIREFMEAYPNISDDKAREFSRRTFAFTRGRLELLEKYSRKLERATSPILAARFAQIENQLLMLVDVQLASDFPLVPRKETFSSAE